MQKTLPQRLVHPLKRVQCHRMTTTLEEKRQLAQQRLAGRKQAGGEPHQLPALVLAQTILVVGQLLHQLTIQLISQIVLQVTRVGNKLSKIQICYLHI